MWTVGSLEPYLTAGISVAGAGVYLLARGLLFGAVDSFLSTGQVVAFSWKGCSASGKRAPPNFYVFRACLGRN